METHADRGGKSGGCRYPRILSAWLPIIGEGGWCQAFSARAKMLDAAHTPQYNPRGEKYLEAWKNDIAERNLISARQKMLSGSNF